MHLFLTGFMGAGKSTVGRLLAERLGLPFVDLDTELELRAGLSVSEIFYRSGEPGFRALEAEALRQVVDAPDRVVATGGGTVTFDESWRLMRSTGISIFLNPTFSTIVGRIGAVGKADRPLFRDEAQLLQLFRERLPVYRQADMTIDIGAAEEAGEVAARLALRIKGGRCAI